MRQWYLLDLVLLVVINVNLECFLKIKKYYEKSKNRNEQFKKSISLRW